MVLAKLSHLVEWMSVFDNPFDVFRYWKVRKRLRCDSTAESFRIRQLGGQSISCRPGTSDFAVLFNAFHGKYHLPPSRLRPDCVIVDLGANIGVTVADFAYKYPLARIVAVEMDIANISLAFQNTQFCRGRCELVHAAVWQCEGEISYKGNVEDAFRVMDMMAGEDVTRNRTRAKTLNSIFEEYELKEVDYLKMDIEGAESVVLSNEIDWIKRVHSMKVEIHRPATMDGVQSLLTSKGFKCYQDVRIPKCVIAVR